MKLVRVGLPGEEVPGILTSPGTPSESVIDISSIIDDITPSALRGDELRRIESIVAEGGLPVLTGPQRFGAPISGVGKIVCVGLNYRDHAREAGLPVPPEPILFMKAADTIVGPTDAVRVPRGSVKTDYEVELAVIIGRTARYLDSEEDPLDFVAGYAVSNDVSERAFQFERGGQWMKGKNCETFNPLGPWLVTADEVADPQSLRLRCSVNGQERQDSSTADMIFPVAELVRYISQFMTLHPGDIINTGTPQGVGSGFNPPRYLSDGDVVEVSIDLLGVQRQNVVGYDAVMA